jgi:uncharacterized membrane protein
MQGELSRNAQGTKLNQKIRPQKSEIEHGCSTIPAMIATVSFPQDAAINSLMFLRLIHFVAGIVWVGFLYHFVLVHQPYMREADAAVKPAIVTQQLPRGLWWFRWASVFTVLSGIWYWMKIVGGDKRNALAMDVANVDAGRAIWTFFALWTVAFIIYMGAMMSPAARSAVVIYIVAAIVVIGAACLYVRTNQHGWESNRLLAIGVGGGMGWFMLFNVWGILWRAQKKMIRWTAAGETATPDFAKNARWAYLASRVNFVLTFPMLFFMAAASHYPLFIQS